MEETMTETDQEHLDQDVEKLREEHDAEIQKLKDSYDAEVAGLKAQIAQNPSVMAAHLDFSKLDALAGAEAAPLNTVPETVSTDDPSLLSTGRVDVAPIGPVAASPFVDGADNEDDGDADDAAPVLPGGTATNTPPDNTNPAISDSPNPAVPAVGTAAPTGDPSQVSSAVNPNVAPTVADPSQAPATQEPGATTSEGEAAQGNRSTDAQSVTDPSGDLTPTTENPPTAS